LISFRSFRDLTLRPRKSERVLRGNHDADAQFPVIGGDKKNRRWDAAVDDWIMLTKWAAAEQRSV
jgi:hypothetical protein